MGASFLLAALLVDPHAPGAASAAVPPALPARVVVVALAGRLSAEEIASGPALPGGGFGKAGPIGVFLERVAFPLAGEPRRLEKLQSLLLPPGTAAETVRLGEEYPDPPLPEAVLRLRARFGAPPPWDARETEAISRLRRAAGGTAAPPRPASRGGTLEAVRSAKLALVLIDATSDSAAEVRRRSEDVHRVLQAAGDAAHVIVACLPEGGGGSVLAVGPLFGSGRVVGAEKPSTVVRDAVRAILEERTPAGNEGEAADLFRD